MIQYRATSQGSYDLVHAYKKKRRSALQSVCGVCVALFNTDVEDTRRRYCDDCGMLVHFGCTTQVRFHLDGVYYDQSRACRACSLPD